MACRACDEICPVNIEILDRILDMRRYLTLMESEFPSELGRAFVSMENQANPWGLSRQSRADWTKELDFEIPVFGENGRTPPTTSGSSGVRGRTTIATLPSPCLWPACFTEPASTLPFSGHARPARATRLDAGNELVYQQRPGEHRHLR